MAARSQFFTDTGTALMSIGGGQIFIDGFESGSTSAWTATVP